MPLAFCPHRAADAGAGDVSLPVGFTSKVAGTERGVTDPEPTFSTCFGAPFMPRRPEVYGRMLQEQMARHGATCWLVNTGWTGGAYGTGRRMPIAATRALLTSALDGSLVEGAFRKDPNFGFDVPLALTGVDSTLLDPRKTWADGAAYDRAAARLVQMFADNFVKYLPLWTRACGPCRSASLHYRQSLWRRSGASAPEGRAAQDGTVSQ